MAINKCNYCCVFLSRLRPELTCRVSLSHHLDLGATFSDPVADDQTLDIASTQVLKSSLASGGLEVDLLGYQGLV